MLFQTDLQELPGPSGIAAEHQTSILEGKQRDFVKYML